MDISNESFLSTLNVISEIAIIAYTDVKGRITYANKKFCEISGYSFEELHLKDHRILNSGHHSKEFFKEIYQALSERKVWRGEIRNRAKNGTYYWLDTQIFTITNPENKVIGYASIRFDITKRKNMENSYLQFEKIASLGSMAAVVAHEINNPLTIIDLSTKSLLKEAQRGISDPFSHELKINKITRSTNQIADIIRSLKIISKCGDHEDFLMINLKTFIEESLALHMMKCHQNGINFCLGKIPDIEIECRPKQIFQILNNLINNSVDAILSNEERWIKILFEVNETSNVLIMRVVDSGKGIDDDVAAKMFTNFFTTKEIGKGTGLSLSVCYSIAEEHGGKLFYDKRGQNSTFVLELPLRQANSLAKISRIC